MSKNDVYACLWNFRHSNTNTLALTFFSSSQRLFPVRCIRLGAANALGSDRQADLNGRELQGTLGGAHSSLGGGGLQPASVQRAGVHGAQQYQTSGQAIP